MRLLSANVNGVRAAHRRGGLSWITEQEPAVVTLQEVRASPAQLQTALNDSGLGDWQVAHAESSDTGRAGVAILAREPLSDVQVGLPGFEGSGRWVQARVGDVTVVSAYVHTGQAGTPRQEEKYAFMEAVGARLQTLSGAPAVLTGDLNICHTARDLRNTKGNIGRAGYLPQEQEHLTGWADAGWVDVMRAAAGDVDGPYTWWSWRGKAFDNDTGWRIDYQWASPLLGDSVVGARVGRADSYAQRWSDHAAVVVDYDRQ